MMRTGAWWLLWAVAFVLELSVMVGIVGFVLWGWFG